MMTIRAIADQNKTIEETYVEATLFAVLTGVSVSFVFEGVECMVTKYDSVTDTPYFVENFIKELNKPSVHRVLVVTGNESSKNRKA